MKKFFSIDAKPYVRVVSSFSSILGIRGMIIKDCGSFAYVKWDDLSRGQTSEDYSVIIPEVIWDAEGYENEIKHKKLGIYSNS